jgi:hypothetical protein
MAENEHSPEAPAPASEHTVTTDGALPIETVLEGLAEDGATADPQPVADQPKSGEVFEPLGAVTNRP